MNEQNRRQIIILVLVLVALGGALYWSFGRGSSNPAVAKGTDTATATTEGGGSGIATFESVFQDVEVDIDKLIQSIEPFEFIYDEVRIARNPAQPVVQNSEFEPSIWPSAGPLTGEESIVFLAEQKKVTGIIWDESAPLAVIDGEVVGEGHEFTIPESEKTIVVKTIAEDFVILSIPSEDLDVSKYLVEVEES